MNQLGSRALLLSMAASVLVLPACGEQADDPSHSVDGSVADGHTLSSALALSLVSEKKLAKLLPKKGIDEYEASGVVATAGMLYVASDNSTQIAAIDTSLEQGKLGPGEASESQYEAITATDDGRFFAMIETASATDTRAEIAELDSGTALFQQAWTDTRFDHPNKGFEGLAWLRVSGTEYLLALCENNDCKNDDSSVGEGRIKVLAKVDGVWSTQASLKLPESVAFLNYSDLALRDDGDGGLTVAVVSHKSSALWLGKLATSPWALRGPSTFYVFPRNDEGVVQYCSVEGITFLGPTVLAAVSDKSDGSAPCTDEEASVHIFQLPQ
ncbi:MAG TPA: hypothetical protein VGJ91_02005 [Polyangiaceae bacterium]